MVGILIGPICNLFLHSINFTVGDFRVTKLTAPALFVCIIFVVLEFIVSFMYFNLAEEFQNCIIRDQLTNAYNEAVSSKTYGSVALSSPGLDPYFYKYDRLRGSASQSVEDDESECGSECSAHCSYKPVAPESDVASENVSDVIELNEGVNTRKFSCCCGDEPDITVETKLTNSDKIMEVADLYAQSRAKMKDVRSPLLPRFQPCVSQHRFKRRSAVPYEANDVKIVSRTSRKSFGEGMCWRLHGKVF